MFAETPKGIPFDSTTPRLALADSAILTKVISNAEDEFDGVVDTEMISRGNAEGERTYEEGF